MSGEIVRVRVLDAHNGRPVHAEKVNVTIRGMRDDVTYTTDANGTFVIDVGPGKELRASTEWRITCRDKRSTAPPMFDVEEILKRGVIEPNTCGNAKTELIPGTITIFTRKATFFENMAR
ncbi:hypothetical protein EDE15_0333 [Edaphobacter aggregans]|uniref:Carboxypeptidase family protein n=1 Tax=Edaphobacter aggregans TaxID=570835 RepID=A0A3R9QEG4_9BACT|nr:hypothetical protein EDE15_0333 [Edaphobacter aggregans]